MGFGGCKGKGRPGRGERESGDPRAARKGGDSEGVEIPETPSLWGDPKTKSGAPGAGMERGDLAGLKGNGERQKFVGTAEVWVLQGETRGCKRGGRCMERGEREAVGSQGPPGAAREKGD